MPSYMAEPTQKVLGASSLIPPRRSVGLNLLTQKKRREFRIQRRKRNITVIPTDFEEASSFARWKTSVKL